MDENNRIIIKRIYRDGEHGPSEEEVHAFRTGGASPASRWLAYLILVPVFIIMAVLGIFFFTAFLALFAVAAIGLGFRLWWLRRKVRKSMEAEEGNYVVIEDAEIVEESTKKTDETDTHERP